MANTIDLTLDIEGMTCASCVRRVEKALDQLPGVSEASVNLATNQAHVSLNAQAGGAKALQNLIPLSIAAVEKAGYGAKLHQEEGVSAAHADQAGWKVLLAVMLSAPLLLPMLLQPLGVHWMLPAVWQWVLATPVQFILGWRFYRAGAYALRAGSGNMDLLVALGTSAAYGLSVWMWRPWALGEMGEMSPSGHEPHLYFEAAAVVITLVMLGKWLESRAKRKTLAALEALRSLRPDSALLWKDGAEIRVPLGQVQVGDRVIIKPGQRVPVDGEVIEGRSHLDESTVTGESLPVAKAPGQRVIGGTLNGEGQLQIRTVAVGAESALSRIVRLVENAQARKAPIQRTVDEISAVFVPVVVTLAFITLLAWGWGQGDWEHAIVQAVSVLVIACPCALGLATPATLMVGTGLAARMGLLVRDAQSLELLRSVGVLALDKTGTLTLGQPQVQTIAPVGMTPSQLLQASASVQSGSEHPLARAVLEACKAKGLGVVPASQVQAVPGLGVRAQSRDDSGSEELVLGSAAWMNALGVDLSPLQHQAQEEQALGRTVSWLARSSALPQESEAGRAPQLLGMISFGDTVRPEAADSVKALQALGIRCVMISGDNLQAAQAIAAQVGIADVRAPVLPQEKATAVSGLHAGLQAGQRVAMVGDGINDAPALAAADVGIAMPGTDVAMETAGLTLLRPDLRLLAQGIDLSRAVTRKIHQNLFWAFAYNVVGIPLAAFGLLSPVVAGAAMAASSVSVIGNALLLRRWRPAA